MHRYNIKHLLDSFEATFISFNIAKVVEFEHGPQLLGVEDIMTPYLDNIYKLLIDFHKRLYNLKDTH